MSLQDEHRARILAAMQRRDISPKDVARMTGLNERTVQRFLSAETFNLGTLARIEGALRLDGSAGGGTTSDSHPAISSNLQQGGRVRPVVGWYRAADLLGVSWDTLRRLRIRATEKKAIPIWRSEAALWAWFERLVSRAEEAG